MSERVPGFEKTDTGILRRFYARPPGASSRAIFVDRDGVINRRIVGGYVTDWSEFEFLPGAIDAIAKLSALEGPIIVVSNQAGVGKGLVDVARLLDVTNRFVGAIQQRGGRIDAVYYCPHAPDDACACRKPKPGLLLQAASDWTLDLSASMMIGDSETDAEAGRAAGCEVVLVSGGDDSGVAAELRELAARLVARDAGFARGTGRSTAL